MSIEFADSLSRDLHAEIAKRVKAEERVFDLERQLAALRKEHEILKEQLHETIQFGGKLQARVCGWNSHEEMRTVSRRIVAALNACEGLTIEQLESLPAGRLRQALECILNHEEIFGPQVQSPSGWDTENAADD